MAATTPSDNAGGAPRPGAEAPVAVCLVSKPTRRPKPAWLRVHPPAASDVLPDVYVAQADGDPRRLARQPHQEIVATNGMVSLFLGSPLDLGDSSMYIADLVVGDDIE